MKLIRECCTKHLLTEETQGNFMNLNSIASLWSSFDLLEVKDILEDVCNKYDYKIRELTFTNDYDSCWGCY